MITSTSFVAVLNYACILTKPDTEPRFLQNSTKCTKFHQDTVGFSSSCRFKENCGKLDRLESGQSSLRKNMLVLGLKRRINCKTDRHILTEEYDIRQKYNGKLYISNADGNK
jgi:hypothetical protein